MEIFAQRSKLPRVKALCEVARINALDLFPNRSNLCIKSALFGTCFADCKRSHAAITNEEATHALTLLNPALDNPEQVKVTN